MKLLQLPNGRLAIRDGDVLLAVPRMHPLTSTVTYRRVLEYVLRRQIGLAAFLAEDEADLIVRRSATGGDRLAALMSQTPHRNARGTAA